MVRAGSSTFALRRAEAACVYVQLIEAVASPARAGLEATHP